MKLGILFRLFLISVICSTSGMARAVLITMDVDSVCTISDYDLSHAGNELRIDYSITNTTQSTNMDDALYRILIPSGIDQTIYSIQVPEQWTGVVGSDDIELYTLNGYEAIQCGETKLFSIFARNAGNELAEIQAMTSIGDWAVPDIAYVPNGQVPEPATFVLLALGAFWLKRSNQTLL